MLFSPLVYDTNLISSKFSDQHFRHYFYKKASYFTIFRATYVFYFVQEKDRVIAVKSRNPFSLITEISIPKDRRRHFNVYKTSR